MGSENSPQQLDGHRCLPTDSWWGRSLRPAAILLAAFLAYAATLRFGFIFDDQVLVVENDSIRSWRYLPSYFSNHIWAFGRPHSLQNAYRPFLLIWLRLNDMLFGAHAWGWHLTLVLAHVAVTYLVYRLCLRLTRDAWTAGLAGLIFGLHPVHVETVAQASWADQPLSTLFILGAILAWWRGRAPGAKFGWIAISMALCAAALLSKESALILPILVAGGAWIYAEPAGGPASWRERVKGAWKDAAPFVVVTLAYLSLRIWALKGFSHTATPVAFPVIVLTIPSVLVFYLKLLVWPTGLSCYYDTPYIATATLRNYVLPYAAILGVVNGLTVWWWKVRQRSPSDARAMAFAALWMVLSVVPVLDFRLLVEGEIAHDRYIYLASVGFAILAAMGLRQVCGYMPAFLLRPVWGLAGAGLLSVLLGVATVRQSLYWADDLTLNRRAHEIAPHNAFAAASLAAAMAHRGKENEAIGLYQEALANHPANWLANVNLAYHLYLRGSYLEAAQHFQLACAIDPTDAQQFLYWGMSLLRIGRPAEAEKAVRTALSLRPNGENYHLGMGMVMRQEGRLPEARREIEIELAKYPQSSQAQAVLKEVDRQMRGAPQEPQPSLPRESR
jgi:Flp pilus assembly protein TadD